MANRETAVYVTYFDGLFRTILSIRSYTLDTNAQTIEAPLVHITITPGGDRVRTNVQNVR